MMRRKKLACLGLAASMALPAGTTNFNKLFADSTAGSGNPQAGSQTNPGNAQLLKDGIDQYNQGQYDQAVNTLQEIDLNALSADDHATVINLLAKANEAATQRRSARAELIRGDEARKANHFADAQMHYNAVLTNPRADAQTRQAAQQNASAIASAASAETGDGKAAYQRAVDEYRKGLWKQARADFQTAQQAGYNGGFLQASPAEYLRKLDEGEAKYLAQHPAQSSPDGQAAYDRAREEYRQGDMPAARADFQKARDLGYQPNYLEGLSPTEYLQRMEEKDTADKGAQVAAFTSGNPASPAPAATVSASGKSTAVTVNLADESSSTQSTTPPPANPSGSDQGQLQHQAEVDRLAQQQRIYKAQGLVDMAKTAEAAGNDKEALSDYSQALDLDPSNAAAKEGHDRLLAKLGLGPNQGGASLTRTEVQIRQEQGAIQFKFNTAIDQARRDTEANDFAQAQNDIANAQAARDEDPTIFDTDDLRQMDSQIAQANLALRQAKAAYERKLAQSNAQQASQVQNIAEQQDLRRRRAAVAAYIRLSRAQIEQQNYAAALGVLDQILAIDPENDYALGIRQFVEDKAILQEQRHYREEFDYNLERSLNQAKEAQIPYGDIFRFPENWPDVATLRDAELRNSNVSKEDQAVQALLDHRLPTVNLPGVGFSDAIDFLRDITGANILVNWKALEAESIDKTTTQVTVALHDVKFSKVLDIILQEAGAGKLAYTIDEGVITISTADELNKAVKTQVYDITDLLINPNFDPTIQNLGSGSAQVTGSGGGSSGGQSLQQGTSNTATTDREQQLTDIKKKIENTVEFSSWKDNDPNGYGQIDDFNNQLIITQTSEVHEKIANLLAQLREAQAVQVSIEARFLTVSRHFLEDVGVNLSFKLNKTNPHEWSPITIDNGSSGFTQQPSTGLPGSLGTNPLVGTTISGSYGLLDDFSVGLILTATEASSRLSIVHAPRVTLQNGQGATVYQLTYIPYVSSLNVSVATGAAIAAPVISYATDGVQLRIERALVSADHKYVTLDIDPQLDSFLGFTTFTFEVAATGTNTGTTVNGTITGGFVAPTLTIQEATEQRTEVRTRVTVPDGGTLMLGGVTIAGEVNLEAGVPGLSKIPFLKRLTTNASESNDEQVLLILVKPTILITKEIEAKNFPLLTSNTK
jgi:type II secretory pathway component GspD/PulD (secretin)